MSKYEYLKKENEEYKETLQMASEALRESTFNTNNLGNVVRLLVNYDLTNESKRHIIERFVDVKTINESAKLFNEIKEEIENERGLFD